MEFPNVLNLKPFMLSEALKEEKELMKKAKKEKKLQSATGNKKEVSRPEQQEKMEDEKDEEQEQIATDSQKGQSPEKNQADMVSSDDEEEEGNRGEKDAEMEDDPEWLKTETDKWLEFNDS